MTEEVKTKSTPEIGCIWTYFGVLWTYFGVRWSIFGVLWSALECLWKTLDDLGVPYKQQVHPMRYFRIAKDRFLR